MNNPFAIFDLPIEFQIDSKLLNERYLALQKALHPDNFVTADAAEQRQAMQKSTAVNDALKTLKDPVLRAEALIALKRGEMQDLEQKSTNDVAFLMQQLQWREELEEIEQNKDEQAIADFAAQIQQSKESMLFELATELATEQWQNAESLCDKLRFMHKLIDEIERVQEHIWDF